MADSPLKGLYLTRLYNAKSDPFAVVSDLPRDQAVILCADVAPWRRVGDGSGGQEAYFDGRVETENFLRDSARAAGVDIKKQNPIYFTLTAEDQTDKAPQGMKAVSIPAEQADLKSCSFTFGDSMGNRHVHEKPETTHPLQDAVLNARQIAMVVAKEGLPGDYIKGGRYIEAQMWTAPPAEFGAKPAPQPAQKSNFSAKL